MLGRRFTCYLHHYKPPFFYLFSLRNYRRKAPISINPVVIDYLTHSLGFSSPQALSLCQRFPGLKTLEKPRSVVHFFKSLGFSDTQIRCSVNATPQILYAHIDNTLKPKINLFQDLGLQDFDLGNFFSKNSSILTYSLDKKLIPCVDILKSLVLTDQDLFVVIKRSRGFFNRDPEKVLKVNLNYLMECGIVGNQLSKLLKRQPRLFMMDLCDIKELVAKVEVMGVSVESKMFVYALQTLNCMTKDTLMRKFQLFYEFGFSEVDCTELFRKMPGLFRTSHEKLKSGLLFFLNTAKLERVVLVRRPTCLMNSLEDRVIPRHKVLEILMSKKLVKKQTNFITVLSYTEDVFLNRFISKFPSHAEELLAAYKGHRLESLEETEIKSTT